MNRDYVVPEKVPAAEEPPSPIEAVAKRASRFSREFLVTVFAVVSTAFGFVVALAWNTALSTSLAELNKNEEIRGLYIYALIVTFLAVIATIVLARLAARVGAAPVEFKVAASSEKK